MTDKPSKRDFAAAADCVVVPDSDGAAELKFDRAGDPDPKGGATTPAVTPGMTIGRSFRLSIAEMVSCDCTGRLEVLLALLATETFEGDCGRRCIFFRDAFQFLC